MDYKDEQLHALAHFLEDVHKTLAIPMVLQYKNRQYPIGLAENHQGINTAQKLKLSCFLKAKLTPTLKVDPHFKIIGPTEKKFHIALKRDLVENIIDAYALKPPIIGG